jgi:hypothetical protein
MNRNGADPADEASADPYVIDVDGLRSAVPVTEIEPDRRSHPRGRFYRPELYSTRERIAGSATIKIVALFGLGAIVVVLISLAVAMSDIA